MKTLDFDTLDRRMTDHARDSLFFVFAVMKSITLGAGGLTFLAICIQIQNGDTTAWLRIPLWAASLWVSWLTFNNVSVFSNLTSYDIMGIDTFILFLKTVLEFLLFAVLATGKAWYAWPILHGLIAIVAYFKIKRFLESLRDERYDKALRPLVRWTRDWIQKSDLPGTLSAGIFFTIGGGVLGWLYLHGFLTSNTMDLAVYGLGVLTFIPLRIASKTGDRLRLQIISALESRVQKQNVLATDGLFYRAGLLKGEKTHSA